MTKSPLIWPIAAPSVSTRVDLFAIVEEALVDAVAAAEFSSDRRLDLGRADDLPCGVGGELVGFAQHIGDRTHLDRHLAAIAGKARGVFDDASDAVAVEGSELFAPGKGANKARIEQHRLAGAHHAVVKISGDLEQIGEFLVMGAQQVIGSGTADQDDLDIGSGRRKQR